MQMLTRTIQGFDCMASRLVLRRSLVVSLLCAAACLVVWPAPAETAGFRVIVNSENPVSTANGNFVADAFLKKVNEWSDGLGLEPVDQKTNSETRRAFSLAVLGRSVAAVRTYWQQRVFSGRGVPPPELDGDVEVVRYVGAHRGAIGYVSEAANLDGVKVLTIH
jgi:ABC-type phosphate transport system substrate-binding protein